MAIIFFLLFQSFFSAQAASRSFDLAFEKVTSQYRPFAKHYKVAMTVVNKTKKDMEIIDQICYRGAVEGTEDTWRGCFPGLFSLQKKLRLFFLIPERLEGKTFVIQFDSDLRNVRSYEDPNQSNNSASVIIAQ